MFLLIFLVNSAFCDVTVNTTKGPVVGQWRDGGSYSTFFGIPYALVDEKNPFGVSIFFIVIQLKDSSAGKRVTRLKLEARRQLANGTW